MRKKLLIDGMSCGHCVNHLKTALSEDIQGVNVIEVNLEGKYATVEMDDSVSKDELKSVIEDIGYELVGIE
ncbi:heavy metal-associated domain-containing protein [Romboutsia sp. 1001216sp1]|uniref:heavy-metal-associated domain-containing protein n=1 Tax=unclassified Romboutsia TaxID=2626894 RepID=UPI00189F9E6B|nr:MULTISPECIES: heavy metal-associated domain-containing protein [unclassified Romboutsia]MDB8790209.1 heavy metal-associated domain-containing protein [Romboutsia sp. 1001216sp1]MDB8800603.1 heavy metal-associated domain-containing protein [Romboutsia sp. 1001216sp1]MDB8812002.1 heavy metal-associated domain-containing protein [Romboutsia sp. 1001216sp1]